MTASACVRRHPRFHAIHRHTILHLTNSRLEIVDGEVADLVAQIVPIHGSGIADVKLSGITGKGIIVTQSCSGRGASTHVQPARCRPGLYRNVSASVFPLEPAAAPVRLLQTLRIYPEQQKH